MEQKKDILKIDITEKKINDLVNLVTSKVNPEWPTIYKIRYVYLEIGKHLYKDADFFFSADGKLGSANLSVSEIKEIYYSELGRTVNDKYLRVICKSASHILKLAYDKLGIDSNLVETNTTAAAVSEDEEFLINHWFLAIHDDENDKIYFATLIPDLPYIQLNMATKHFGVNISYKKNYKGEILQVYKGDEIKHSVIPKDKLKEIDMAIGYINKYYHYNNKSQVDANWFLQYDDASLYILRDNLRDDKLFYELEIEDTSFYENLTNFKDENNNEISFLNDDINSMSDSDWNYWIKLLCKNVLDKIQELLGYEVNVLPNFDSKYWNYDSWLMNLCSQIQYDIFLSLNDGRKDDFSNIYIDVNDFKYNKWSKKVKNHFDKKINNFDYGNILLILDKLNNLINCVNNKNKSGNFNNLFLGIAYHFIEPSHLYENNISRDGFLSNYYIANKFNKLFRKVFSCNELVTEFNNMGYAEKVTIIKNVLLMMFPEITKDNSCMLKEYNDEYHPIFNRIQIYPIKNKENGYFSILFNILGETDYYFFYNAKTNTFRVSNALDIYNDYIIISNRMKNRISVEDLEKIDGIRENFEQRGKKIRK